MAHKGFLGSIEFLFVEFVTTGVVGKLTGVGKDATGLEHVDAANVEFDAGVVTPQ